MASYPNTVTLDALALLATFVCGVSREASKRRCVCTGKMAKVVKMAKVTVFGCMVTFA